MSQFAFKRTGDADYPRFLKVLLQGPPKSGKTTFITTAPNVVIASCEAGLMSIAHLDVPYVEVDGTDKLQSLEMVLRDDTLRAQAAKKLGMEKIETVAIDTLDAWQEMLKKEILAENRRTQMQQADWGTLKERMATILKRFTTLPVNVIFTVHTSTTQDEESRLIYAPALQGGIKDEIAGYVDFSLLAFRQRETDAKGAAKVKYYLKNEGDLKNPHLGNRAAGRVPEICEPDFATLHKAVFTAIERSAVERKARSEVIREEDAPEAPAQTLSQAVVVEVPEPTGVPADDPQARITATGVTMLTKQYTEHGLVVPEDLKSWNLDKGRKVSRYFTAWKADKVAGKNPTRDDLTGVLEAYEAFAGEMPGVQTGVENLKPSKAAKPEPEEKHAEILPATEPLPEPEPEVTSEPEQTEEGAVALIQETFPGATVISHGVKDDAKCETCSNAIDDKDIANLAVRRFKKALCVKDYKLAVKAAKQ
jgi:hypothetical protein